MFDGTATLTRVNQLDQVDHLAQRAGSGTRERVLRDRRKTNDLDFLIIRAATSGKLKVKTSIALRRLTEVNHGFLLF